MKGVTNDVPGPDHSLDPERCYRAVQSKDSRFDGWFFTAVATTGIYCRPSCPAVVPKRENVRFYATAAAAQLAGFRACKRCRPDAVPGSPAWNSRADLVARAMRLIADGVVDRDGVSGLARRLNYSERQLHRQLVAEVGAGPIALARAKRAQTARVLIETSDLPISEVAFAAGFASIRQFNDTVQTVFATTPSELRRRAVAPRGPASGTSGKVDVRLPYREPFHPDGLLDFLALRAVPGVEEVVEGPSGRTYRRSLRLPRSFGTVELTPTPGQIHASFRLEDLRDLAAAVQRCRRLFDLDADPVAIDELLGGDEHLGRLVTKAPGRRSPGHVDPHELAVRAVLGQQVSVLGARTLAARFSEVIGDLLESPIGGVTRVFPSAEAFADAPEGLFAFPAARRRALQAMCRALADGSVVLDPGSDPVEVGRQLLAIKGIGPWTVSYIAMRALGDPDIFLESDLGVRHAMSGLGLASDPKGAAEHARRWRPWRSYAMAHLWASLS